MPSQEEYYVGVSLDVGTEQLHIDLWRKNTDDDKYKLTKYRVYNFNNVNNPEENDNNQNNDESTFNSLMQSYPQGDLYGPFNTQQAAVDQMNNINIDECLHAHLPNKTQPLLRL